MKDYYINLNKAFQKIDHFGASGAWSFEPIGRMWSVENKNRIADLLFSQEKGIGLSVWRFAIGAGGDMGKEQYPDPPRWRGHTSTFKTEQTSSYNWNSHVGQNWFLHAAKNRGVKHFIAMVYSPPAWMTKNGKIAPDETVGQSNLPEASFKEFAMYIADIAEYYAKEGVSFDAISPFNEPSWSWDNSKQEGNRYSNDQMKSIVSLLHNELKLRKLTTEIDIPEAAEIAALLDDADVGDIFKRTPYYRGHDNGQQHGGKYREYIKDFLGDEIFRPLIGSKLSYHSYWADHIQEDEDRLVTYREQLRKTLSRYDPQAKLWQTEYCNLNKDGPGRDLGMSLALFTARVIHFDLTVAQVSSWQWWLALSPHDYKDGLLYTDFAKEGDLETIFPSKTFWTLGQYSKFIRPGSLRIELRGEQDPAGLLASAFRDPANQTIIIVLVNYGQVQEEVTIHDPSACTASMQGYITSANEGDNLRNYGLVNLENPFVIPGRSIITLYGKLARY